jgi:ABC-2 type transport system permease protein
MKIALKLLKDNKLSLIVYTIASLLFALMYVSMFPSMAKQSEQFMEAFKNYPKDMMEAFGIEISQLSFSNVQSFLAMENFSLMWPIMVFAMSISLASSAIAGDIEKGTMSIFLSQPISRVKLYYSKVLSGFLFISIFVVLSVFLIPIIIALQNIDFKFNGFVMMAIIGWFFSMAIYGVMMFLSSIFSEKGKVMFMGVGLIVLMYAINVVANLKDSLDKLKYLSFFHYFDQQNALVNAKIDWHSIVVFTLVAVVCIISGSVIFKKRDIIV